MLVGFRLHRRNFVRPDVGLANALNAPQRHQYLADCCAGLASDCNVETLKAASKVSVSSVSIRPPLTG